MGNRLELARSWAAIIGYYAVWRPTEWAALELWRTGQIKAKSYIGHEYAYPRWMPDHEKPLDLDWLHAASAHPDCVGYRCNNCEQRKPLSDYYQDETCKTGYKTICKGCIRKQERQRYAKNMQRPIRPYARNE